MVKWESWSSHISGPKSLEFTETHSAVNLWLIIVDFVLNVIIIKITFMEKGRPCVGEETWGERHTSLDAVSHSVASLPVQENEL